MMNSFKSPVLMKTRRCGMTGTTLLEVLLAIVIFVVGMMALASLQGNLTRSSSDANMRTVAANIAEETIEGLRAFEVIETKAGKKAYNDIVSKTTTLPAIGGVVYTVATNVQNYYFLADRVSVSKTPPTGVTASAFKNIDVTVTWNTGQEFQVSESQSTSGRLGSGTFKVTTIVPAILSLGNAKVAADDDGALGYPPVDYTPGQRPDIVAISLGDSKFKESTTPEPTVIRKDELVETWFDVITYTTSNTDDSVYLRREEFASVSCECTLHATDGNNDDGRLPTQWDGAEYVEGATVGKPYGTSASNQQSPYCDVCCQDHHDEGSGATSYRPNAASHGSGDHKHYSRNKSGVLTEVTAGKDYLEACRLIRKDGFFRVAQDFSLESQSAFPENYLDDADEVGDYSDYVTSAVDAFYTNSTAMPDASSLGYPGTDPGIDVGDRTPLPTGSGAASQQLRSRGIYADVLSSELQANLAHCFDNQGAPTPDDTDCHVKNASSPLELYPFFDVQLTKLARWTVSPTADPVDVTNEELETDNMHSRGVAELAGSKEGLSTSHSNIETGNVGLISIAEIASVPAAAYSNADLYIIAGTGVVPPTPVEVHVAGTLTNAGGTTTNVASVTGTGATCTRPTNTTFTCLLDPAFVGTRTLRIGNYYTKNLTLIACSVGLGQPLAFSQGKNDIQTWTEFALPSTELQSAAITVVSGSSCP